MIFYFLGRYLVLASLIGLIIIADAVTLLYPIVAAYILFQLSGVCAIGLASINLAIRVFALWNKKVGLMIPIFFLIIAHWTLTLITLITCINDSQATAYVSPLPSSMRNAVLSLCISVLAMMLDLVILVSLWYRLSSFRSSAASPTGRVLLRDGSMYFLTSLALNTASVALAGIGLAAPPDFETFDGGQFPNTLVSFHFSYGPILSGILSTMVASRAVRHLSDHMSKKEIILLSKQKASIQLNETLVSWNAVPVVPTRAVRIQMDTLITGDDVPSNVLDIGLEEEATSVSSLRDTDGRESKQ